jgi:hypothetical protein
LILNKQLCRVDGGSAPQVLAKARQRLLMAADDEPAPRAVSMIEVISRAASDPSMDMEKMVKLVELHERIQAREAKIDYSHAMARLAMQMPRITHNALVTYEKNGQKTEAFKFAPRQSDPAAGFRGGILAVLQDRTARGRRHHCDRHAQPHRRPLGKRIDPHRPRYLRRKKNNIQAMGSSFSYGKRYTATMLLNLVTEGEDNDGQSVPPEFINQRQIDQITDLLTACRITVTPKAARVRKRPEELPEN